MKKIKILNLIRKNNIEKKLFEEINKLNKKIENQRLIELIELVEKPSNIFKRNLFSGIAKGIGAGIGFTIVTGLIIYLLQKIIKLNIPIISKYISDIIEIVEKTR